MPRRVAHFQTKKLDNRVLHSYAVYSDDAYSLKNSVYDDSICLVLKTNENIDRGAVIKKTLALLACDNNRSDLISRRCDSLLAKQIIYKNKDGFLKLSEEKERELEISERIYLKEFSELLAIQSSLFEADLRLDWSKERSEKVASILSKIFIKSQVDASSHAGAALSAIGFLKHINDPIEDLREYLADVGVPGTKIDGIVEELISYSGGLPLIKKLSRASLFVAFEGADSLSSAKALGTSRWSDVKVQVDASVAIPFLCSSIFQPTKFRFHELSKNAINKLIQLGTECVISHWYLTECAAHLHRALKYDQFFEFGEELRFSDNAYVSHYFTLKNMGVQVPKNLNAYLNVFSENINKAQADEKQWIRRIQADLQPKLRKYGIDFEYIEKVPEHYKTGIETELSYAERHKKNPKSKHVLLNDINAIAHNCRQVSEKSETRILLTWDNSLINIGKKITGCGWIVNPSILYDFIQPYLSLDEKQFCSLCHRLARAEDTPSELTAKVIDTVVNLATDECQDWQFQEKIKVFQKDLLNRIEECPDRDVFIDWVESETKKFLEQEGIKSKKELKDSLSDNSV